MDAIAAMEERAIGDLLAEAELICAAGGDSEEIYRRLSGLRSHVAIVANKAVSRPVAANGRREGTNPRP